MARTQRYYNVHNNIFALGYRPISIPIIIIHTTRVTDVGIRWVGVLILIDPKSPMAHVFIQR